MVATYRREAWHMGTDSKLHKINRVDKPLITDPSQPPGTPFILATGDAFVNGTGHEPKYYLEGGIPSDAGPFAPTIASTSDPGIAGIRPGVTRANYSGSINWSTPQYLKDYNFTGAAAASLRAITGPDHTLSNCYIPGLDTAYTGTQQGGVVDCRANSVVRLRLEYCTIRPTYPNDRWDGIYGHDFTAYRCLIERTVDVFACVNPYSPNVNVSVQGTWGGHQSWFNDDRGVHGDGTHNDWMQHHTGLYVEVLGCTIWGYKWNALNPTNSAGGTTPLAYGSSNTSNRWPQTGQGVLMQTEDYFHIGNDNIDGLFIYGCDAGLKPSSKCGIAGHNHRYNNNPSIQNVRYMNDDHRDYGGSLHFYQIRTDNAESFNGVGSWPTTGATPTQSNWNIRYASSSSADRKYNIDPTRRGTLIPVRCDVVV